ncbi:MAG: ORF6N domain-containing protein, partial [Atopobiaceae bacterium]|nr:ORF6N domain-containing protein [Atopobiaceae bacterium]
MDGDAVLAIADERDIRGRIYMLRGRQVMLDSDLAEIYGYTTKAFNQQVRRN